VGHFPVAIAVRQSEKTRQTDLKVSPGAAEAVRDGLHAATECVIARSGFHRTTISRIARTLLLRTMSPRVSPGPITPDASVSACSSMDGLALVELMDPTIVSLDWRWMPLR